MSAFLRIVIVVFWSAVVALWWWWRVAEESAPAAQTPAIATPATWQREEIARHNSADNCWLVIRERVYDVSQYIQSHPTAPEAITRYCGTDATTAFETKDRGRPHSSFARNRLAPLDVGALTPTSP